MLTIISGGLESVDLAGYTPKSAALPVECIDVAQERRERAALLVLAIGRGYAPRTSSTASLRTSWRR